MKLIDFMESKLREKHDPAESTVGIVTVNSIAELRLGDMVAEGVYVCWLYFGFYEDASLEPPKPHRVRLSTIVTFEDECGRHIYEGEAVEMELCFPMKVVRGLLPQNDGFTTTFFFPDGYGEKEIESL